MLHVLTPILVPQGKNNFGARIVFLLPLPLALMAVTCAFAEEKGRQRALHIVWRHQVLPKLPNMHIEMGQRSHSHCQGLPLLRHCALRIA